MRAIQLWCVAGVVILAAGLSMAAQTNLLSFAYATSVAAHASTPDTWGRKLNDGYWTNSVTDGVRYDGDAIAATLDLNWRTKVSRVDVYTFTVGGGSPLSTQGAKLEISNDNATWGTLGALSAVSNGLFSYTVSTSLANVRYLRLTCLKGGGAVGQSLAEIVVSGASAGTIALASISYTNSIPANPAHGDPSFAKLKDGAWSSANNDSVQYGANSSASVNPLDPTNCVASNVVILATLNGVRSVRRAHLYAFCSSGSYVTSRVTVSNSLDGVNWTCAGQQTNVESLSSSVWRFDFILPNVEARYVSFSCEKGAGAFTRQLLGEVQVFETVNTAPALGDPLAFTYEFNMATTSSHDNSQCPKLTDGVWDSNTRNAVRFYGDVVITADLGAARYVAGADLICWSNSFVGIPTETYATGRVVVNGSLDKTNWTQLADITRWNASWPYHHAASFTNPPYARYLRFDTYRCDPLPSLTNTAQIIGELAIYRPPSAVIGALPVTAASAIPNAGFEDPQIPDGDSATMLIKGGSINGWTFSNTDSANYAGYQRNNSPVSTNTASGYLRYAAPEGYQTAVLMGSGSMESQISVPTNGTYALQVTVNSTVFGNSENGGYDFRVRLDGVDKGIVAVMQLTNTMHQVLLADVAAGTHTLRFEGVNSKAVTWGALIDNLRLKRYEMTAEQIAEQGRGFVFVADSTMPLALDYTGTTRVKELWLDGALMSPAKYSAATHPTIFEGPGAVRYDRGTLLSLW